MTSQEILRATSRAFFLSLRILPGGARQTMSLAYLLARCADSVSDGLWLPTQERIPTLHVLIACIKGQNILDQWQQKVACVDPTQGGEAALLHHLPYAIQELAALAPTDRLLVQDIVITLSQGMLIDLQRFPGAIKNAEELHRHLWSAAGCVGSFWTKVLRLHEPRLIAAPDNMEALGTHLGNALQITNVLRDLASDLQQGRCYLPTEELAQLGLTPQDLQDPSKAPLLKPLMLHWLTYGYQEFLASRDYVLMIPGTCWRLRLAALWPWCMGLATLRLLCLNHNWLSGSKIKVSRPWVYGLIVKTALLVCWTPLLKFYLNLQLARLEQVLASLNPKTV